ncbi:MAG: Ger(x)C family spore germination protein [Caldicoprobacterales bacterium]|jgi:spore germination protein KC|nr:Ger(x)C family spore germination protein [Clostridiales bacterium]
MKTLVISLIVVVVLSISGCRTATLPQRREIDDLLLAEVLGLDKSTEVPGNHIITIASRKLDQSEGGQTQQDGGGGEGKISPGSKALITTAQGKTLFDAARNIQNNTDKTLFWAHTKYFLIGEEAARDDIAKYIDFISRDHEFQLNGKVYIVKGTTAKDLMIKFNQSEFYIADKLESLGRSYKLLGTSEELELVELMRFFDIHFGSARIPCIQLVDRESDKGQKAPDIESDGYAIAADLKLVTYTGRDISRGVNLITNNIDSSIVTVKDLNGEDVSLEIIFSNTEAIPHFTGDILEEVTLRTKVVSNLGEIQSQVPSIYEENIEYMEAQQSAILENEMRKVLEVVRESESDCLNICDMIRLRNPVKWHKIEKRWNEILQYLKIHVEVESRIRRSYELDQPSGIKGMK